MNRRLLSMNNKGRIKRRLHKLKQIEREKLDDRIVETKVEENTQEPKEKSEIIIKNVDQVIVNNEFNIQSLNNDDKQLTNDNIVLT